MSKSKNIFLESMTKIYILAATKIVNVISYLEEIFEVIVSNKKNCVVFLFSVMLIFGISINILMGHTNDPGRDGAFYYDIADNIKEGRGNVLDVKDSWFDWETNIDDGQVSQPNSGVVVYPFFQSFLMSFDDSLETIIFANVFLSTFTILLLFLIISDLFDNRIALVSSFIFIFNPLFFSAYTSILSEAFYLTLFVLNIYILLNCKGDTYYSKKIFFGGFLSSILFLTRFTALTLIITIFVWFSFNKETRSALTYLCTVVIFLIPWFVWNKLSFGVFFAYYHISGRGWPVAGNFNDAALSSSFLEVLRSIMHFGFDFSSISLFFIISPFVIIGLFRYSFDRRSSLLVIFFLIIAMFHLPIHYRLRYMLPLVPLLLPLGLDTMKIIMKEFNSFSFGIKVQGDQIYTFFVFLILLFSFLSIGDSVKDQIAAVSNNHNEEKYEWLIENSLSDQIICSTEPRHAHYYTGQQTIRLAFNLDQTWLDVFIDTYNISFIVVEEQTFFHYADNSYLKTLYDGNEEYILEENKLILVHQELGYGNDILFYQVVKV